MKSQRRHELEHNVLDTELTRILAFFKKNGSRITYGVLIVLLIALVVTYWTRRSRNEVLTLQTQYAQLKLRAADPNANEQEIVAGFNELAGQTKAPYVAADSLLQIASHYAMQAAVADEAQVDSLSSKAAAHYERVIAEFPELTGHVAAARLGLGKLAEGKSDFAKAKTLYQAVLDMPGIEGYPVRQQAEEALALSANWTQPAMLATTQPAWANTLPVPESASQPTSAPAMAPATAPAS